MASRLSEMYRVGDQVEICFSLTDGQWRRSTVVGHEPPGMWVRDEIGRRWFVTNTRRVRPASEEFGASPDG